MATKPTDVNTALNRVRRSGWALLAGLEQQGAKHPLIASFKKALRQLETVRAGGRGIVKQRRRRGSRKGKCKECGRGPGLGANNEPV